MCICVQSLMLLLPKYRNMQVSVCCISMSLITISACCLFFLLFDWLSIIILHFVPIVWFVCQLRFIKYWQWGFKVVLQSLYDDYFTVKWDFLFSSLSFFAFHSCCQKFTKIAIRYLVLYVKCLRCLKLNKKLKMWKEIRNRIQHIRVHGNKQLLVKGFLKYFFEV